MSSATVTIRTRYQITQTERREIIAQRNSRGTQGRHLPLGVTSRDWSNSHAGVMARHQRFRFNVPDWLLPKNGVDVWATITASIIWGICGKMCDES